MESQEARQQEDAERQRDRNPPKNGRSWGEVVTPLFCPGDGLAPLLPMGDFGEPPAAVNDTDDYGSANDRPKHFHLSFGRFQSRSVWLRQQKMSSHITGVAVVPIRVPTPITTSTRSSIQLIVNPHEKTSPVLDGCISHSSCLAGRSRVDY